MTAEATNLNDGPLTVNVPAAGYAASQVIQLPDGRAGLVIGLQALTSGDVAAVQVSGRVTIAKTATIVVLPGGRVYWDRSANTATPLQAIAGADFFLGVCPDGAASADATIEVDLNVQPSYLVDLHRDAFDSVLVAGATIAQIGGQHYLVFTSANEAQKGDLLSVKSVPVTIPCILEAIFRIETVAGADVADLNVGLANATHASDCDSIVESCFFHQDSGADLNLDAESDDNSTEVAATDTTVDVVAGTDLEVWIDARVLTSIKMYVNGQRVLSATTFKLNAATGPLKALFHWEKSSDASVGAVRVSHLAIRTTDLAS